MGEAKLTRRAKPKTVAFVYAFGTWSSYTNDNTCASTVNPVCDANNVNGTQVDCQCQFSAWSSYQNVTSGTTSFPACGQDVTQTNVQQRDRSCSGNPSQRQIRTRSCTDNTVTQTRTRSCSGDPSQRQTRTRSCSGNPSQRQTRTRSVSGNPSTNTCSYGSWSGYSHTNSCPGSVACGSRCRTSSESYTYSCTKYQTVCNTTCNTVCSTSCNTVCSSYQCNPYDCNCTTSGGSCDWVFDYSVQGDCPGFTGGSCTQGATKQEEVSGGFFGNVCEYYYADYTPGTETCSTCYETCQDCSQDCSTSCYNDCDTSCYQDAYTGTCSGTRTTYSNRSVSGNPNANTCSYGSWSSWSNTGSCSSSSNSCGDTRQCRTVSTCSCGGYTGWSNVSSCSTSSNSCGQTRDCRTVDTCSCGSYGAWQNVSSCSQESNSCGTTRECQQAGGCSCGAYSSWSDTENCTEQFGSGNCSGDKTTDCQTIDTCSCTTFSDWQDVASCTESSNDCGNETECRQETRTGQLQKRTRTCAQQEIR